jgi:hypothetical protein
LQKRLLFCVIIAVALTGSIAQADYYFYGVGNDEFQQNPGTLWSALSMYSQWDDSRCVIRQNWDANDGKRSTGRNNPRDSMYDDLLWYADNLKSDDLFMFFYAGHGGWNALDNNFDEGKTPRPRSNDPCPANDPPYEYDEFFGYVGGSTYYMWDDDLKVIFDNFDPGVTVVVISGACHSGGWIGGANDLDKSAPALNNALCGIFSVPEQGLGIGVGSSNVYEILLTTALTNTVMGNFYTMSEWYDAAMAYGETNYYILARAWDTAPKPYYYWPSANWVPSEYEATWFDNGGYWGWERTYLQLRSVMYSTLDAAHDRTVTPEPSTIGLVLVGLAAIRLRQQRRRTGSREP